MSNGVPAVAMRGEGISIGVLLGALLLFVGVLRRGMEASVMPDSDLSSSPASIERSPESDPASDDDFGASFAILPDRDGDGWKNILVGSPSHRGGVVREFSGDPSRALSRWRALPGATQFGQTLALVDGGDEGGASEFLVGAPDWFRQAGGAIARYSTREEELLSCWSTDPGEAFFGEFVVLGDLDADGDPEILLVVRNGWASSHVERDSLLVVAARSGKRLRSHSCERSISRAERAISSLPDIDGDSAPDYAACLERDSRGILAVWSGRDGSELEVLGAGNPTADVTGPIIVGGDQDGDGLSDLTYGCTERVETGYGRCWLRSYSTMNHAFLRELLVPAETLVEAVSFPDRDGDGIDEMLVGVPDAFGMHPVLGSVNGGAILLNGKTGERMAWFMGPPDEHPARGRQLAIVDLDGDGELEILMSRYSPYTGGDGIVVVRASDGSTIQSITGR